MGNISYNIISLIPEIPTRFSLPNGFGYNFTMQCPCKLCFVDSRLFFCFCLLTLNGHLTSWKHMLGIIISKSFLKFHRSVIFICPPFIESIGRLQCTIPCMCHTQSTHGQYFLNYAMERRINKLCTKHTHILCQTIYLKLNFCSVNEYKLTEIYQCNSNRFIK